MAFPNEDDDAQIENADQLEAVDAKDQAQLDAEGSNDAIGTSTGLDSTSPYSTQLKSLLTQYQGALTKRSTDRTAILAEAQRKLLARAEDPMGQAALMFKVAGAFGKPTRTGAFGETLGNVGEAVAPELEKMQARKDALSDLQLKYKQVGLDQDVSDIGSQIGVVSKLAQLTQGRQGEYQTLLRQKQNLDPTSPTYSQDKTAIEARMSKLTWTPPAKSASGPKFEIDRLTEIVNDPTASADAKKIARARIAKLNYIAPTKDAASPAAKPQSPAGKQAVDEGLTIGTVQFNDRVKEIIATGKASQLSPREEAALLASEDAVEAAKTVMLNANKALAVNSICTPLGRHILL
jgi:hypothetical protein